jgi:hypothetical protein
VRRALCVGINDYPVAGADLKGCVNDATAWARLLTDHYDFAHGDITTLTNKQATKQGILTHIDRLLKGTRKGDVIAITVSSHGTYVADNLSPDPGDEPNYDEAICPYDMRDDLLVDDELRQRFANIKAGVRLTMVSDSCYSGSVTRDLLEETPDDRRPRFVRPAAIGRPELSEQQLAAARGKAAAASTASTPATPATGEVHPESKMHEVLVTGCRDDQTSFDARFGRVYHGAMSYFALSEIAKANYDITYRQLWDRVVVQLSRAGYDQEPQVEGSDANLDRRLFD